MTSINRILMRNGTQYTDDIIRYKRQWKMITLIDSRKIYHRNKALLGYYRTQYTRKFFHRSCDRIQIKCSNNDTISSVLLLCSFHLKEDHICASHICASWKWQLNWKKKELSFRPTEDVLNQNPWVYAWPAIVSQCTCYLISISSFPSSLFKVYEYVKKNRSHYYILSKTSRLLHWSGTTIGYICMYIYNICILNIRIMQGTCWALIPCTRRKIQLDIYQSARFA